MINTDFALEVLDFTTWLFPILGRYESHDFIQSLSINTNYSITKPMLCVVRHHADVTR